MILNILKFTDYWDLAPKTIYFISIIF